MKVLTQEEQRIEDDKKYEGILRSAYRMKQKGMSIEEMTEHTLQFCQKYYLSFDKAKEIIDSVYDDKLNLLKPKRKRSPKRKLIVNYLDFDGNKVICTPVVIFIK